MSEKEGMSIEDIALLRTYWNVKADRERKMRRYQIKISVLRCKDCGWEALAFEGKDGSGLRITGHKCGGAWETVRTLDTSFSQQELDAFDMQLARPEVKI